MTDTLLVVIGVIGSLYYTSLIGILVLAGWFLLEFRRAKIRKKLRPLVVYPAIRFSWVVALVVVGLLGFIGGLYSTMFNPIGYLVLLVWWLVSLRVFRYQKSRARIERLKRRVRKRVSKKKAVRKKVPKKKKKAPKRKKAKKKAKRKRKK